MNILKSKTDKLFTISDFDSKEFNIRIGIACFEKNLR